jgi:hypothetical protein
LGFNSIAYTLKYYFEKDRHAVQSVTVKGGLEFFHLLLYHIKLNCQEEDRKMEKMEKAKIWLTDDEVEQEIERLNKSEAVALARREARLKYKRRQILYNLRALEKQGKALLKVGITREILDAMYECGCFGNDNEEEE